MAPGGSGASTQLCLQASDHLKSDPSHLTPTAANECDAAGFEQILSALHIMPDILGGLCKRGII